ncbi:MULTISPECIES: GAF domain-containing SpoIIE family protein phosphatase [unclassified Streptomyces]|uniref:PP2C family protein-serine/threonine phosphatase n=2 Tax=Streptomyces TaxID=1883 RepID=UPI0033EDD43B
MSRDDGGRTGPPVEWQRALHLLWRAATAEVQDVTGVAEHVYDFLLPLPGVGTVVGARWDDRGPLYLRRGRAARDGVVTWLPSDDGWPGGQTCPDTVAADAVPAVRLVDLGAAAPVDPPLAGPSLRGSGAAWAVECVFPLAPGDSAALWLGLDRRPADEEAAALQERLTQVAEILRAGNERILEIRAHERRQVRDAFLAEASLQMDASLDARETLHRVSRLAVPAVAEGCVVHLFGEDGRLAPVATAHVAASAQSWLTSTARDDPWMKAVLSRGAEDREGIVLRGDDLTGGPFGTPAGPGGPVQALSVSPLRARGRVLGTLTFLYESADAGGRDLRMLSDLAGRAALAIDTTTLYEQRRRHVQMLQRHLLPRALPEVEGLELSAAYHVGDPSLDVGGDFYDVVVCGETVSLVIGDVCGRGAEAAAATALARHTLRTLLEDGVAPAAALARLNRALTGEGASRFVTALVIRLVPADGGWDAEIAGAGHPWPYVRRADGEVAETPARGLLLGVVPDARYEPAHFRLAEGDTLVLFTDGLTEARSQDGTQFEEHAAAAVGALAASGKTAAEELVAAAAQFRDRGDDDTAVLTAKAKAKGTK